MSDHPFRAGDVDLTPAQVRELHDRAEIELVDVREAYEVEQSRIAGSRHVEMERLAANAQTIDRERPVVFYCRLGARSGLAASAFRRAGWNAYSMVGGLTAWDAQRLPLDPPGAGVADH
jgi:hydroxyacylglutathione hydrolase/adenylyltransferase/sulfurtransferase